jgi:hypothetical protein
MAFPAGENWLPPPEEMPPPEDIDVGLLSFTSFFFLLSRNSLALVLSAVGRERERERERLGLSLDGFRFRPCAGVLLSSSESSSSLSLSLSLSLSDVFWDSCFCHGQSAVLILSITG